MKQKVMQKKLIIFGQYLGVFFIFLVVFYLGVAWGKQKAQSTVVADSRTKVSFLSVLTDPKTLFERNPEADKDADIDFNIFWEAWKEVDRNYIEKEALENTKQRVYGAVKGMVAALGDPYSLYLDPEETKEFNTELDGKFTGIGAELSVKDGILTVVAPIEGMPAAKAGLRAGDRIIKINDELTSEMSIAEAVKKIRGPKGTKVVLTVLPKNANKTKEVEIIRDEIDIKSVAYEKKGDLGYIRIKSFMDDTADEFEKVVTKVLADKVKGLVVDVRSNPGGNLEVATKIISKFVPKGEVILWERDRQGKEEAYHAYGGADLTGLPVVVLIDEGSASAAEILAGALRDDLNSPLIGQKSFGKGSVQVLRELSDGSSLKITIAEWLIPSKQSINKIGLQPDIEVEFTEEDLKNKRDRQLERALKELQKIIDLNAHLPN